MKTLAVLNDAPCGSERTCNGARRPGRRGSAVLRQEAAHVFPATTGK